jgi:O-6-methylguanine DNA methyltransferase
MNIETSLARLRSQAVVDVWQEVELGVGLADGYREYDSPLGQVAVTFNPAGITAVDLSGPDLEERFRLRFHRPLRPALPPVGWDKAIGRAIEDGRPGNLPLDLSRVSEFQRSVLMAATAIPRGQVRPYVWLARQAGKPGAARAVGSAMARNPVPLIVPCHRVVRADGKIGAYSLGGPENKWKLLRHEGADPDLLEALASQGIRYLGATSTGIFCHPSCDAARRIRPAGLQTFHSRQEAEAAGFRACLRCRPE